MFVRHQLGLKAPTLLVPGLPSAKFADANHLAASIKGVCGFSHSIHSVSDFSHFLGLDHFGGK